MKNFNVGIVGLGWVAGAHIETYKAIEGASVTAVFDVRPLNSAELEKQFGIPIKVYNDYDDMLKDDSIDIIDICSPHPFHPGQAIKAAHAGKHVVIEKPLAPSYPEAIAIKEAVQKAGVFACVCLECRYSQHFTMIKSCIDQDLFGDIHFGEVDYYHGIGPWYGQYAWNIKKAMGISSLLTAGVHALDALMMFMKDRPVEEVTSYSTKSKNDLFTPYEYDTSSTTIIKFKDGSIGKVSSIIDCLQPYYFHIHLVGQHGSLLDNKFYSQKLPGLTKERWSTLETSLIDSGDVSDHPYKPQFQAFIDGIREGRKMPLTDIETAFQSHRIAYAADMSAEEGRPVKLSEL